MKTLYYFEDYIISDDEEVVEDFVLDWLEVYTDDGLVLFFENNIFSIDSFDELLDWSNEYQVDLNDLYDEYGIDLSVILDDTEKWK